jgi:hypothetical protein
VALVKVKVAGWRLGGETGFKDDCGLGVIPITMSLTLVAALVLAQAVDGKLSWIILTVLAAYVGFAYRLSPLWLIVARAAEVLDGSVCYVSPEARATCGSLLH